ncbi:hypothetical protein LINPERPRIM_LOCUS22387 [Linum perenne]
MKADPHIKSKHRFFKDKFLAQLELKNTSGFGWDDSRNCVFVDDAIFAEYVKHHPKAKGLNKRPLPYWDQLCLIFGNSRALGADAVQLEDAASVLQGDISMEDATDINATPFPMADYDAAHSHELMQELLNAGFDLHANSLQSGTDDTTARKGNQPATSSGQKRKRKNANDAYFASL